MLRLRVCVLALLLVPVAPSFAAPLMPSTNPTMEDVDPGIDDTGRDKDLPAELRRQSVYYRTEQPPGTIIVNTHDRYLYLIMGNGVAMRYGVGVGRDGFQWGGIQKITLKREWPDWVPPPEMIVRQPYLPRWMAGGPGNPLGARAMNLGGTVYRIHGTNAPTDHWAGGVVRLLPAGQRRCDRSLFACAARHQGHGAASIAVQVALTATGRTTPTSPREFPRRRCN